MAEYKVSITEDQSINNVYDVTVFDDNEPKFPITDAEFQMIRESSGHNLWQYKNGKVVESEFKAAILRDNFNAQQKKYRQEAYQKEADPLFMKYQRGEATKEEWETKVAQIASRYPYQE